MCTISAMSNVRFHEKCCVEQALSRTCLGKHQRTESARAISQASGSHSGRVAERGCGVGLESAGFVTAAGLCLESSQDCSVLNTRPFPDAPNPSPAKHVLMSLFSSFIIDPVVRQARRFSSTANNAPAPASNGFHMPNADAPTSTSANIVGDSATVSDEEAQANSNSDPHGESSRPHGSSTHRHLSVASVEQQQQSNHDGTMHPPLGLLRRVTAPSAPMDIPGDGDMSANPSHTLEVQLRRLNLDQSHAVTQPRDTTTAGHDGSAMSELLPADDGMRHLRARIHDIRALRIDDDDKARMMHSLMTERYNYLRPTSPSSFVSHDRPFTPTSNHSVFSDVHYSSPVSTASDIDPENIFNLRPGDAEPTYRPQRPAPTQAAAVEDDDADAFDEEASLGCEHYKRNVKVQCYECRRWYTCRHCHDAVEDHSLERKKTENMLCMSCGTPQKAAEYCMQCGIQAACYYCDICKLWDNNSSKKIYHCEDCGICRRGEGLGKDYIHCKVCGLGPVRRYNLTYLRTATSAYQ